MSLRPDHVPHLGTQHERRIHAAWCHALTSPHEPPQRHHWRHSGPHPNRCLRAPMPLTGCGAPAAAVGVAGLSPPRPSCWHNSGPACLLSVSRWLGGSRRASWVSSFLGWGKPWSRPRGADRSRRSSSRRGDRLPLRPSSVRRQGIIEPAGMVRSCAHGTTRARARHAARAWSPRVTPSLAVGLPPHALRCMVVTHRGRDSQEQRRVCTAPPPALSTGSFERKRTTVCRGSSDAET